jgi:hypothetical protein
MSRWFAVKLLEGLTLLSDVLHWAARKLDRFIGICLVRLYER